MNIAWLVQDYEGDDWEIVFEAPSRYAFAVKQIVWVEIKEGAPQS